MSLPPSRIVIASAPMAGYSPGLRPPYALLKGLASRGHRVTLLLACERPEHEDEARQMLPASRYDLRTYLISSPRGMARFSAKWRSLREPFGYMFSSEFRRDLAKALSEPWDILHLESNWAGWLGLSYDRRKALLNFYNLYRIDEAGREAGCLKAAVTRRLRYGAEARLARSYPTLAALTDKLAEELRGLAPEAKVHVCPAGMDLEAYPYIPAARRAAEPVVSLIGSMSWPPSLAAAQRLLTKLWPALKAQVPEARCQIVGWGALGALRPYLGLPGVEIAENVPVVRPYFERATLLLYAPPVGSGVKLKVMEAFAFGVPVVTTRAGIEGLPAQDGIHAGICDEDPGLVARALRLLKDRDLQERQRAAARGLVEASCGPAAALDAVERGYAAMARACPR